LAPKTAISAWFRRALLFQIVVLQLLSWVIEENCVGELLKSNHDEKRQSFF